MNMNFPFFQINSFFGAPVSRFVSGSLIGPYNFIKTTIFRNWNKLHIQAIFNSFMFIIIMFRFFIMKKQLINIQERKKKLQNKQI